MQADAHPPGFGGEERREHPGGRVVIDPGAPVGNAQHRAVLVQADRDFQPAIALRQAAHGLDGVAHEVDHHLLLQHPITAHLHLGSLRVDGDQDADAVALGLPVEQRERIVDHRPKRDRLGLGLAVRHIVAHPGNDAARVHRVLHPPLDGGPHRTRVQRVAIDPGQQAAQQVRNRADRLVQLMGQGGRHLAHRQRARHQQQLLAIIQMPRGGLLVGAQIRQSQMDQAGVVGAGLCADRAAVGRRQHRFGEACGPGAFDQPGEPAESIGHRCQRAARAPLRVAFGQRGGAPLDAQRCRVDDRDPLREDFQAFCRVGQLGLPWAWQSPANRGAVRSLSESAAESRTCVNPAL